MFDKCSIDFRSFLEGFSIDFLWSGKGCRSSGGPLEEHWGAGGGSEGWKTIGKRLEEEVSLDDR